MTDQQPRWNTEEEAALAVLAKRHRILAVIVPKDIATEKVQELSRQINDALDRLVLDRDSNRSDA